MKLRYDELRKRKTTYQEFAAIAAQHGIKELPPDHPVFSEGVSITFLSHTPEESPAKVTTSTWRNSPSVSDSIEYFNVGSRGTLSVAGYRNIYEGQDAAYRYFLRVSFHDLRKLGVAVVEGQCPGNDYCAAELHGDIRAANRSAKAAGIPVRFRKARR